MRWEGVKVGVTGGAGFIGSHLVRELVRRGARVTVVDNLSTGRLDNLRDVLPRLELVRASTLEEVRVSRALKDAEVIFHLAAVLGVKRTWEEPVRVIHENVRGTENVLRAASNGAARRVVLASSSEVYGDGEPPYSERATPAAPRTGYAAAKLLEEKLAEAFHHETGLKTACLRYFNVFGPAQENSAYGFVTAIFCSRVREGLAPVVFGSGEQTRDFTYVDDIVDGTLQAAGRAGDADVLNLGTGRETRVLDLARAVLRAAGREELGVLQAAPRRDEVRRRVADLSHAERTLAWRPRRTLGEGLRETLRAAAPPERPAEAVATPP